MKKKRNKTNYNSSNKTELKIFSNVRRQYLYNRVKPRGLTLCIIQYGTGLVSFY